MRALDGVICSLLLAAGALRAQAPYPPSPVIAKLDWADEILRRGTGKDGQTGDNWPITWGADGEQYTSYGDGGGFANPLRKLTLGFARITGDPPAHRGEDILSDADTPAGWGNQGIKSSGMLAVDGTLYLFVRNYRVGDNYRHSRLAWSADSGRTWRWADWHFAGTFGCPDFVQFGPGYRGARDSYVYVVSQANDDAYEFSPDIVLARVPRDRVARREAWEFFAGRDAAGQPRWSADLAQRRPVFTDPRGAQRISMTWVPALDRYLLTASHRVGPGPHNGSLGVFDAPEPWGPWTTIYYDDYWSGRDRTYHHKFPARWLSGDGRSLWLLYSGLGGGNYAFCLRRATLTLAPDPAWISLFDGRTLAGWRVAARPADREKGFWTVRNGAIYCDSHGRPDHDYVWLLSEREFGDFDLTLEVRGFTESTGNTGVQIRSRYDEAAGWLDGPQIDIHPPAPWRTGMIYDETRTARRWIEPSLPDWRIEASQTPLFWRWYAAPEQEGWNHLLIRARGARIRTWVNGVPRADLDGRGILDDNGHRERRVGLRGHLGLQLHTKDELRVEFRNIRIRPLD